mmetsp:Transcript_3842/g.5455  ORF Transcript_3842/g.5455 Transcript_3842/m.5455 type:complete len:209 (+) Transcript_3842:986-1612(+)
MRRVGALTTRSNAVAIRRFSRMVLIMLMILLRSWRGSALRVHSAIVPIVMVVEVIRVSSADFSITFFRRVVCGPVFSAMLAKINEAARLANLRPMPAEVGVLVIVVLDRVSILNSVYSWIRFKHLRTARRCCGVREFTTDAAGNVACGGSSRLIAEDGLSFLHRKVLVLSVGVCNLHQLSQFFVVHHHERKIRVEVIFALQEVQYIQI